MPTCRPVASADLLAQGAGMQLILHAQTQPFEPQEAQRIRHAHFHLGPDLVV